MKHAYSIVLALAAALLLAAPAFAVNSLRISQIYGAGGNAGATYNADFVELYNAGGSAASLTGFSVQYAAAAGTTWSVVNLSGSIAAGGYYLIRMSAIGANGAALPGPDLAAGTVSMAAAAGKLALCNSTTALTGSCPTGGAILDFAGYGTTANCFEGAGPTPAPSTTQSAARISSFSNFNIDTDQNATDFVATSVCPRWSGTTGGDPCGPTPTLRSAWGTLKSLYR